MAGCVNNQVKPDVRFNNSQEQREEEWHEANMLPSSMQSNQSGPSSTIQTTVHEFMHFCLTTGLIQCCMEQRLLS